MSILLPAFAKSRTHRPRSGARPRSLLGYVLSDPIQQVGRSAVDSSKVAAGMLARAFGYPTRNRHDPGFWYCFEEDGKRKCNWIKTSFDSVRGPRPPRPRAGAAARIGSFLSRSPAGRAVLSFYGKGRTRNDVRAHRGVTAWAPQIQLDTGRSRAIDPSKWPSPWWIITGGFGRGGTRRHLRRSGTRQRAISKPNLGSSWWGDPYKMGPY